MAFLLYNQNYLLTTTPKIVGFKNQNYIKIMEFMKRKILSSLFFLPLITSSFNVYSGSTFYRIAQKQEFSIVSYNIEPIKKKKISCTWIIGNDKEPRIVFSAKESLPNNIFAYASLRNYYAESGFRIKIDDSQVLNFGKLESGAGNYYYNNADSLLNSISNSKKIEIYVWPTNSYYPNQMKVYNLEKTNLISAKNDFLSCIDWI